MQLRHLPKTALRWCEPVMFSRLLGDSAQRQAAARAVAGGKLKAVDIAAPLTGRTMPLDNMPSAVFKQRLLGEGVALEPSGCQVFSPIAGKIEVLDPTGEQIRIRGHNDLHLLIHIGTDTKRLMGESVKFHTKQGKQVELHQPLLQFNLPMFRRNLPSILVAITLLNSNKTKGMTAEYRPVLAREDRLFTAFLPLAGKAV